MPNRAVVFAAKAAVLTGALLLTGVIAVLGSLLTGRIIMPGNGFTQAHGYPPLSLSEGPTLRAVIGSVLYLVLIGLLGFGVTTAVRDSATGSGIVLGLLYIFPVVVHVVADPVWRRHLEQLAPMSAGLAVQSTTGLDRLPIGPWSGLGVLAVWSAAALFVGALRFSRCDA
jgi:ABC-2 type transport system permease protein